MLRGYWGQLSAQDAVEVPFEKQMWGDEFGACTDRFGVPWMVDVGEVERPLTACSSCRVASTRRLVRESSASAGHSRKRGDQDVAEQACPYPTLPKVVP